MPKRRLLGERLEVAVRKSAIGSCERVRRAQARTPAMPTSITRNAATTETMWKRRSSARAPTPRRITSRTTMRSDQQRRARAKSAHRATSSRHVVPDAPTASVGGGAGNTDAEREHARRASARRLRSRASEPCSPLPATRPARRARRRRTRRPLSSPSPESDGAVGREHAGSAFDEIVTGSLKRSRISVGGVSTRDCVTGSELMQR